VKGSGGGRRWLRRRSFFFSPLFRCAVFFLCFSFSLSTRFLPSLQWLRGDAGGGGLGSGLDGGRPFFLFFSAFFFNYVRLCFRFFLLLLTGLLSTGRAMAAGGDAGGGGEESNDAS